MFSKYIHTFTFNVGSSEFTARLENDDDAETFKNAVKRCKEKYFIPAGLHVTSIKTIERKEENEEIGIGSSLPVSERNR